jgi:hypothetical protein
LREALRGHDASAAGDQHLNVSVADLQRAGYEASQNSNTFSLMDYSEASRYAALYRKQAIFDALQQHAVFDVEMALVGSLPGPQNSLGGVDTLSTADREALLRKIGDYRAQPVLNRAGRGRIGAGVRGSSIDRWRTLIPKRVHTASARVSAN